MKRSPLSLAERLVAYMSNSWILRMSNGDEHILNEKRYKAFLEADKLGVRFLHIGDTVSINMAFVDKVWKQADTPDTFKDAYLRDDRSSPGALRRAREVLERKLIVPKY